MSYSHDQSLHKQYQPEYSAQKWNAILVLGTPPRKPMSAILWSFIPTVFKFISKIDKHFLEAICIGKLYSSKTSAKTSVLIMLFYTPGIIVLIMLCFNCRTTLLRAFSSSAPTSSPSTSAMPTWDSSPPWFSTHQVSSRNVKHAHHHF